MRGIYTARVVARVVDRQAIRDGPNEPFVHPTMSYDVPTTKIDNAIPTRRFCACPRPTVVQTTLIYEGCKAGVVVALG